MHLPWIDAVRGLAALAVFLHHAYILQFTDGTFEGWQGLAFNWLLPSGHLAVDVFIVLSGYCLALSAQSRSHSLQKFFKRRAKRILPAFYAALVVAAIANAARLAITGDTLFLTPKTIVVNLLLLQDLFPVVADQFSITNWSVAVEAKIYLLFPLLLYAGRWRIVTAIALTFTTVLLIKLMQPSLLLDYPCPWYIILFVLGMNAANSRKVWRSGALLGAIALIGCLTVFHYTPTGAQALFKPGLPLVDLSAGVLISSLFTWFRHKQLETPEWLNSMGVWSYSLYLVHYPLLKLLNAIAAIHELNQWLVIAGELPIVLLLAYGFYRVFEQPWLRAHKALSAQLRC